MRRLRHTSAAAVLAAATLALTACSGGSGGGSGSSSATQASATTNDINATPRSQVQQGGDLRWPIDYLPANFNYNELDGADQNNAYVINALMPTTFDVSADAKFSVDKDYFTSIDLTTSPQQVVTYTINPKATWSDGTPITVADFVSQWKALNGSNPAYQVVSTTGYDQVASVEQGADDHQVKVTFSKPYADWQGLFSPLYPASTNNDPNVFNTGWVSQPQVTAGPFQLQGVDASAQTVTLVPNPKWWADAPKLDRIIYRAIDGDAQIDALANNEVDFIDVGPNVNAYQRAQGLTNVEIRRAGGPNFRHLTINGSSPLLQDVHVRHAIAQAIDRTTIAKAMLGPLGGKAEELNNHIYMANQEGYQDNAGDLSKPDAAAANKELDAAGWTRTGDATRTKDGKPLELRMVIPSQVATSAQESQLMQTMLAKVGVKLDIQTVPSADFFDKYVTPGDFDMTVFSWIGTPFPVSSNQSIYSAPQGDDIQQNYARVGSKEIDDAFAQATQELDPAKARADGNAIDKMIWQEVHSLTLYQRPDLIAANKKLANYGALGFASVKYQDIGFTK